MDNKLYSIFEKSFGYEPKIFTELFADKDSRPIVKLDDIQHKMKYTAKNKIVKPQNHFGQRKLLLSEIQFLNKVSNEYILYAGSAPGNKSYLLSLLYPEKKFILVDPNEYKIIVDKHIHREIKHPDIIHLYHHYPTKSNVWLNLSKNPIIKYLYSRII